MIKKIILYFAKCLRGNPLGINRYTCCLTLLRAVCRCDPNPNPNPERILHSKLFQLCFPVPVSVSIVCWKLHLLGNISTQTTVITHCLVHVYSSLWNIITTHSVVITRSVVHVTLSSLPSRFLFVPPHVNFSTHPLFHLTPSISFSPSLYSFLPFIYLSIYPFVHPFSPPPLFICALPSPLVHWWRRRRTPAGQWGRRLDGSQCPSPPDPSAPTQERTSWEKGEGRGGA